MIDWHVLCENLRKRNLSLNKAATMAGVPAHLLQGIWTARDLEPPFSAGIKLLDLHYDTCPDAHRRLLEE